MGRYKNFMSNTFFMLLGTFSSKVLVFLLVPLYTSILSTEEYAIYDLLITTVSLLSPFLTMNIAEGVMRFCLDKLEYKAEEVLTIGVAFVFASSLIMFALTPVFALVPALEGYSLWLALFFFVSNIHLVLTQYLKGINEVKLFSSCGVFSTLITVLLNILFLVVFDFRIIGYMLAHVIAHATICLFIMIRMRIHERLVRISSINERLWGDMFRYCTPMIPNSLSWWVSNSSDKYMVTWLISKSALGVYSVAYKIPSLLTMVTSIFTSALQISAVEDFGSEESKRFYEDVYVCSASICCCVSLVLIVLTKPLAYVLFKNGFYEAWKYTGILIMAYNFNFLAGLLGTVYTSAKKTRFLFYSTAVAAVVNIVLNFVLINQIGVYGAAIATCVSYWIVWFMRICNVQKIISIRVNIGYDFLALGQMTIVILLLFHNSMYATGLALFIILGSILIAFLRIMKTDLVRNRISYRRNK